MRARTLLVLGTLAACGSPSGESQGPPPLLTQLPRDLSAPESRIIQASNQFGFAFFQQARRAAPDDNLFISPLSAAMALGMTLQGAAGTTLDSMRAALRLGPAPLEEIAAGYRSLLDLLAGLDDNTEFQIANSIWADSGFPFLNSFLATAQASFDAAVRTLDLQAPASLGTINDWVKQHTGGKIPTILDRISADEVMFLINAIYFKGKWRLPFDPRDTRAAPFHAVSGDQSVPTMSLEPVQLRYDAAADHQTLELLYGNGAFAMTIVLPGAGRTLNDLAAELDASHWAAWTGNLHDIKLGLTLPKFRLEYKRELKDDLSALGMAIAFDPDQADFSRMADPAVAGRLYITRATQKTFVEVNEEGTEAAAATVVGIGPTSAPATLEINRPFLFVLRERLSGTVFFIGQVTRIP